MVTTVLVASVRARTRLPTSSLTKRVRPEGCIVTEIGLLKSALVPTPSMPPTPPEPARVVTSRLDAFNRRILLFMRSATKSITEPPASGGAAAMPCG
jgi:hypothetical protein